MGLAAGEHVAAAGVRRRVERLKEKWHFQLLSLLLNTHIQSHTHSLDKTLTSITATDQDITQPKTAWTSPIYPSECLNHNRHSNDARGQPVLEPIRTDPIRTPFLPHRPSLPEYPFFSSDLPPRS